LNILLRAEVVQHGIDFTADPASFCSANLDKTYPSVSNAHLVENAIQQANFAGTYLCTSLVMALAWLTATDQYALNA
jgi:hypothetical protein